MKSVNWHYPLLLIPALILTACGGGSGNSTDPSASDSTISGSVVAAPVNGALCELQDAAGRTLAGPFNTDASGRYSTTIATSDLANDIVLACNGGTFINEADGSSQTAGPLMAYAGNSLANGAQIHATPASTIINRLRAEHGMTPSEAQNAFQNAFGFVPDTTVAPSDATGPAADASTDERLAGLRAATFSQLTADLGLNPDQQFELIAALAEDLADGALDGDATSLSLPADIQNRFGMALINFRDNSRHASGLENNQIGALPFARTAVTENYRVEYLPGMMDAMQGRNRFQVRVSDKTTAQPATGLSIALMPMMHMATMSHSTPTIGCSESATAGTYDCELYYLMASSMMDGTSMGYWDVKLMIGGMMGEEAHFYPPVMMAMGDTTRALLRSSTDQIKTMTGDMANRRYFLFKSELSNGSNNDHNFSVFIAAEETMMSFPAIYPGVTLTAGMGMPDFTISSMQVEMSATPDVANSWVTAQGNSNDGHWVASGISGLSNGTQGTIYIRLTINGTQYTTTGDTVNGSNDYAEFSVTPGGM